MTISKENSVIKMKVCFVGTRPFILAPRAFNEIKALSKNGYYVRVIGFDEKRKYPIRSKIDGEFLVRIRPKFWFNRGLLKLLNFPFLFFHIFKVALYEKADIYHCYGLLSFLICLPIKLIKHRCIKIVYDSYEDFRYQMSSSKKPIFQRISGILWKLTEIIERFSVPFANYVLTIDSVRDKIKERFKRMNKNVKVIMNVPELDIWNKSFVKTPNKKHKILFYVGGLRKDKGVLISLKALKIVKEQINDVKMMFAGIFQDASKNEVKEYIKKNGLEEAVTFLGMVPYQEVSSYLTKARVGLVPYLPTYWHLRTKASSKLFLYMKNSIPIVASNFPGFKEIINNEKCGILVKPDPKELGDAIIYLLENPQESQILGENGRKAIEMRYNWNIESKKLIKIYNELSKYLRVFK